MKKILIQLDSDRLASVFDAITAYDAGVDRIMQYGGVTPQDVRDLVYGAMFTRGGDDLRNSAVFIGGADVALGEKMMKTVVDSFFGPVRVSVMLDANGCNTTAAAAVKKITSVGNLEGKKVVVMGGTGPVGMRAAALMAGEGAQVLLTSRSNEGANKTCADIKERFGAEIRPVAVRDFDEARSALKEAYGALCAGAAGITMLPESIWLEHPTLCVLADVNAVPPLGIEKTKPHWNAKEVDGKVIFGALAIGGLKMKIHRHSLVSLFETNDRVIDVEQVYDIAKTIDD
jgi:hypothetical protein